MSNFISIRTGATALPEESVTRLTKDLISVSGVVSKAGNHWQVVEHNPQNMSVDVSVGAGFFYGTTMTYHGFSTAANVVVISANSSGNPRIDTVVAYVDKGASPTATADNVLLFVAVPGTPAGSPSAPSGATIQAAVGAGNPYLVLADVAVANGASAIANANITDTRVDATTVIANLVSVLATITTGVITSIKTGGDILDSNGNELLGLDKVTSAVNNLNVTNSATGDPVIVSAVGDDDDIDLNVEGKGKGMLKVKASYMELKAATDGATVTLDMSLGNAWSLATSTSRTLAVSNVKTGQRFSFRYAPTGALTLTWFSTITWMTGDGTAPVQPATGKVLWVSFICTGSGTYDGFIDGFNG